MSSDQQQQSTSDPTASQWSNEAAETAYGDFYVMSDGTMYELTPEQVRELADLRDDIRTDHELTQIETTTWAEYEQWDRARKRRQKNLTKLFQKCSKFKRGKDGVQTAYNVPSDLWALMGDNLLFEADDTLEEGLKWSHTESIKSQEDGLVKIRKQKGRKSTNSRRHGPGSSRR